MLRILYRGAEEWTGEEKKNLFDSRAREKSGKVSTSYALDIATPFPLVKRKVLSCFGTFTPMIFDDCAEARRAARESRGPHQGPSRSAGLLVADAWLRSSLLSLESCGG